MSVFFLCCAPFSFLWSCFDSLYFLHCHISNILLNENKTAAMKEEMQMENHSWGEAAKNTRTSGVAKVKGTSCSLSLSLKMLP